MIAILLSPNKNFFRRLPPALFGDLILVIWHSPLKKKFHRLPPTLFGGLMIVMLHYSPQKNSPAAAVIVLWSNTCNLTFSPQKKISPAAAGIIWWSHDCNFTISPQKNFRRLPPALFGNLILVILHSPLQKKDFWGTKCGRFFAIRFYPPPFFWVSTPPWPPSVN